MVMKPPRNWREVAALALVEDDEIDRILLAFDETTGVEYPELYLECDRCAWDTTEELVEAGDYPCECAGSGLTLNPFIALLLGERARLRQALARITPDVPWRKGE